MIIRKIPVSQINPAPYNPRRDLQPGDPEYEKLKRSLAEFGCVEPLVWNERTFNLVGGHQRFKVLMNETDPSPTELEVSVVDLDDEKEKLLNLALNKITGEFDDAALAALLADLTASGADVELSGFDEQEVDKLLADFEPEEDDTVGDFENAEITLGSFDGDKFEHNCPRCGFAFNDGGGVPRGRPAAAGEEADKEDLIDD